MDKVKGDIIITLENAPDKDIGTSVSSQRLVQMIQIELVRDVVREIQKNSRQGKVLQLVCGPVPVRSHPG